MDMTVPDHWTNYMARMTYYQYSKKYNPEIFLKASYELRMKEWDAHIKVQKELHDPELEYFEGRVVCCDGWSEPKINHFKEHKYTSKKCRNLYDARMRPMNLYIRFLEHKVKYGALAAKIKK